MRAHHLHAAPALSTQAFRCDWLAAVLCYQAAGIPHPPAVLPCLLDAHAWRLNPAREALLRLICMAHLLAFRAHNGCQVLTEPVAVCFSSITHTIFLQELDVAPDFGRCAQSLVAVLCGPCGVADSQLVAASH